MTESSCPTLLGDWLALPEELDLSSVAATDCLQLGAVSFLRSLQLTSALFLEQRSEGHPAEAATPTLILQHSDAIQDPGVFHIYVLSCLTYWWSSDLLRHCLQ